MNSSATITKAKDQRPSQTDGLPAEPIALATATLELPFTQRLIRKQARRLAGYRGFSESDESDISQELNIAVYQGCLSYQRNEGVIEAFVATVVHNRVAELVRNRNAQCRSPESEAGSLNQTVDTSDGPAQWVDVLNVEKHGRPRGGQRDGNPETIALAQDTNAVLEGLGDETREIARLLMHHSPTEVEQQLQMTRGRVRKHMEILREQFETRNLREYLSH